jgi:hypothetical protein
MLCIRKYKTAKKNNTVISGSHPGSGGAEPGERAI